jgi:glutamine amidotransferase
VITVIDYQMGNAGSIMSMLARIGAEAELTSDPARIRAAEKLVLPGVGAFDDGMRHLTELGIAETLVEKMRMTSVPFLGICLGMQLLADSSEEGTLPGLGIVPGRVVRFRPSAPGVKVPHMGWNTIQPARPHYLFENLDEETRFYFVHSFYFVCREQADCAAATEYDGTFTSAVSRGCAMGVQFHPEKSLRWGKQIFTNFVRHV